jgi:Protein of unknown function (DUF3617)
MKQLPLHFALRQSVEHKPRPSPARRATAGPIWTTLLGAAACCIGATFAAGDGIAPGEWKLTETVVMNGQATPTQTRTRCLSAEQAGDTAATFTPEYGAVTSGCSRVEFKSTATALNWRMQCTGQMEMDVTGDFTFDTPKHYSARIVSKGAVGGREFVNSSVAIEGEHIGECR